MKRFFIVSLFILGLVACQSKSEPVSVTLVQYNVGVFDKYEGSGFEAVANAVKRIPIDYVDEIFANGIVFTGGGAELYGLDKMLSKVLGVSVTTANNPADCVARGLSLVNAFLPIKMRNNGKNITAQLAKYYKSNNKK